MSKKQKWRQCDVGLLENPNNALNSWSIKFVDLSLVKIPLITSYDPLAGVLIDRGVLEQWAVGLLVMSHTSSGSTFTQVSYNLVFKVLVLYLSIFLILFYASFCSSTSSLREWKKFKCMTFTCDCTLCYCFYLTKISE